MIPTQPKDRFFVRKSDFEKLLVLLREQGVRNAMTRAIFGLLRRRAFAHSNRAGLTFDRQHNVRTCGRVQFSEVKIENESPEYSLPYEPTPTVIVPTVLPKLANSFGGFAFVDLGSGKGRMVLLAAQFDFDRVIGVEFAQQLHQLAQENVDNYRGNSLRCKSLTLTCEDAKNFDFPSEKCIPSQKCIIFIFNPFKRELLTHIVDRLATSHAAKPRTMYIVFVNAEPKKM
jgi:hypothetical protein